MLYMKEMRAKVVAECTLKESAAINQILGRRVCNRKMRNMFSLLRKKKRCRRIKLFSTGPSARRLFHPNSNIDAL